MNTRLNFDKKVEILPNKKSIVSARKVLNLIERKPEKIENIKFVYPKIGSRSLGKFIVEHEW